MSLPSKTRVWNNDHPSFVTIAGRGKDHSPNRLGNSFEDFWIEDLVHVQAIRASFLLESNTGYNL